MTDAMASRYEGSAMQEPARAGVADKVRNAATEQLTNQKQRATDGLGSVAQAVRQSTQHLREQQHETIAWYAEQAADQIDKLSQRLRDTDVAELATDLQQLARRQPALFIGGAFALGLIGARFFKSSARPVSAGGNRASASLAGTSGQGVYAQATEAAGYRSAGQSRVHDYQALSSLADNPVTPQNSSATGSSGIGTGGTKPRSRRGTPSERS
jgi:2-succinyl-5-enolpyruvyl-6-hydroxy-3-cyclohexene-1-carboxylate synthase